MAGSLNRVQLIGNLGRDPEVRTLSDGKKVANLSIATSESWKSKETGERKEKTEWHRVTIWGQLAEIAEKYLKKGSKVYLSGALQTRKWTDKDGAEKYTTEIVLQGFNSEMLMLDGKPGGASDGGWDSGDEAAPAPKPQARKHAGQTDGFEDSEIPF